MSWFQPLRGLVDLALTAVFPPRCVACLHPMVVAVDHGLCPPCFEVLEPNQGSRCVRCDQPGPALCSRCAQNPPPFESLRAPWLYGGPLADALHRFKFGGEEFVGKHLGRLLVAHLGSVPSLDGVVPVPPTPARSRQRGFNPAAVLARAVAVHARRPVRHLLHRPRSGPPQSTLALAARWRNMDDAFRARPCAGMRLLLVDDVVTSTATLRAAAQALRGAGADAVVAVALARQPLD